jgi:pimeloyl-ACP methyl ester carboxylesterase
MRARRIAERAMKRREAILAIAGLGLLWAGASFIRRASLPRQDTLMVAGHCHTPATIFEPPAGRKEVGTAILLHGLGANRRTMMYLGTGLAAHGFRTYLADLPGHGDSTEAFTFAEAELCASATLEYLIREGQIDPKKTILVGHSMGGAIAIRMADRTPVTATIAISPAPMVLPRRIPANLLVISGQYDLWPMRRQARDLAAAAEGARTAPRDFAEQRAFELEVLPHATHASPLINQDVAHLAERWAMDALAPNAHAQALQPDMDLASYDVFDQGRRQLLGEVLGIEGLVFLFPACVTFAGAASGPAHAESTATHPPYSLVVAEGAVGALISVLLLAFIVPLRLVRLYDGDYLASAMLVSGGLLLLVNWNYARHHLSFGAHALLAAGVAGFAVMLAFGAWFNWQLVDLWMNAPRWLRFAALLPVAWVFCFAEEVVLGPPESGKRGTRFAVFVVMRLELWLACVLGYYTLANGEVLIGMLAPGLAVFSVGQRLATNALRVRIGRATAAAIFGAILAAWFIAAVFPLT